jgi:hypothetical protein
MVTLSSFCIIKIISLSLLSYVHLLQSLQQKLVFNCWTYFLLFGAPHILQSDNGREITATIIKELKDMWPDCSLVHGKPRHPQSQGSVERGNADI